MDCYELRDVVARAIAEGEIEIDADKATRTDYFHGEVEFCGEIIRVMGSYVWEREGFESFSVVSDDE